MFTERIVVTGMGLVSPLGLTREQLWDGLTAGASGVRPLTQLPPNSPVSFGAEAWEFVSDIDNYGPLSKEVKKNIRKGQKIMSRETRMGLAAAQRALADAGFEGPATDDGSVPVDAAHYSPDKTGIYFGSDYQITMPHDFAFAISSCLSADGKFDFDKWAELGLPKMNPLWLLIFLPNMPSCHITMYNDMRGASNTITQREASGNMCLEHASHLIDEGAYDIMLCGATGTRLSPMKAIQAFKNEPIASSKFEANPDQASRPFDSGRTGQVLGEGAGCIVLETEKNAKSRNAAILAELVSGASSMVARQAPNSTDATEEAIRLAVENVLKLVLERAEMKPSDIDFIVAHGLGEKIQDRAEAQAIKAVFDDYPVKVVAPKANFGNMGAGAGIVELIAGIEAINKGTLFPVRNCENQDPDCPINLVREPVPAGKTFINLSFSPQAQASAVLMRKY